MYCVGQTQFIGYMGNLNKIGKHPKKKKKRKKPGDREQNLTNTRLANVGY